MVRQAAHALQDLPLPVTAPESYACTCKARAGGSQWTPQDAVQELRRVLAVILALAKFSESTDAPAQEPEQRGTTDTDKDTEQMERKDFRDQLAKLRQNSRDRDKDTEQMERKSFRDQLADLRQTRSGRGELRSYAQTMLGAIDKSKAAKMALLPKLA